MGAMSVEELLLFFRALADRTRLKIVGLLASGPLSVEQLAAILNLRPSTISHHLSQLAEAGLVSARSESYYNVYRLDRETMEDKIRQLLAPDSLPAIAADVDADAYDRKVFADYLLPDGRLKTIPAQQKKLEAVLRRLVLVFEPDVYYTEEQVNSILRRFHPDTATLRRELVGRHLMARQKGMYWRLTHEKG